MYLTNQKYNCSKFIYIALILSLIGYVAIILLGDFRSQILNYLSILLPIYTGYFFIVFFSLKNEKYDKNVLYSLIIFATIIRIILIPTDPILSDDIFRYLWEGKVFSNGFNPYLYAPNSPELKSLQDNLYFPYINYQDIPASYPPVAQLFFVIAAIIGYKIFVWKIILLLVEAITCIFILKLIDHFSMNRVRLSIYLLNPLVIIETYSSGHFEVIGVCFLIIALYYFYRNISIGFLTATILATLVKYIPILILIPFMKKKIWFKLSTVTGAVIVILILFSQGGATPIAGVISYANRWEFNGALYNIFNSLWYFFGFIDREWFSLSYSGRVETIYITGAFYYKIIACIVLIAILVDQLKKLNMTADFRGANYLQSGFIVCAAILLLSPTLYPWYLIWIIPFLVFIPNWSWLFFTFLIQFSYYILQDYAISGVWHESSWILILQYVPFYSLLILEYIDKRKIKGWFL